MRSNSYNITFLRMRGLPQMIKRSSHLGIHKQTNPCLRLSSLVNKRLAKWLRFITWGGGSEKNKKWLRDIWTAPYHPHTWRDLLSPVSGIFFLTYKFRLFTCALVLVVNFHKFNKQKGHLTLHRTCLSFWLGCKHIPPPPLTNNYIYSL